MGIDGVPRRELEEQVDVVVFDRQFLTSESEFVRDRPKALLDVRAHVRVAERPPPLRAPDQVVLAVVFRMAAGPPAHADIMALLRTETNSPLPKGQGYPEWGVYRRRSKA